MKDFERRFVIGGEISGKRQALRLVAVIGLLILIPLAAGCSLEKPNLVSASPGNTPAAEQDSGSTPSPVKQESVSIPAGTNLSVRLLHAVSSRSAKPGESFDAELAAPLVIDGKTIFPKSTLVRGRVVSAKESGRLKDPGYLRLTLAALQTPEGKWINLETNSVSAKGESHKKRNATLIGGGAGTGALIGAIAGGGKGAAIGAGVGAGAGTAGAYATGTKDVSFSAEARLNFKTTREVSVS